MGRSSAVVALALGVVLWSGVSSRIAWAADDDLVLDLGSAERSGDAGTGLRKLELRRIPKGTFSEGAPASDLYREPDEVQRNVTLTKAFWMGKYPVTRAQFARFISETRFQTDAEKGQSGGFGWDGVRLKQAKEYTWRNPGFVQSEDDPVTLVTFGDANAFTAWASRKTGRRVRLPTEAEFEVAARGGTTTPWYGAKTEEEASTLIGWYRPQPGAAVGTHPVGRKKANPFGLFDMSGNVNEWTLDVYAPWTSADVTDPTSTTNASATEPERRVLRGGSWMRDPRKGRSASRYRNTPGTRNADNGFRVVVEDEVTPAPAPTPAQTGGATPAASSTAVPSVVPQPIAIAPPVVQRQSTEGIGWAFLAAPVGAASFVIAWMLARRKKPAPNAQGITTRPGDDGFWVSAPNLPPGSRVRYTCIVNASDVTDVVPLDGGDETFVFTGGVPSAIRITEAVAVPSKIEPYRGTAPTLAPLMDPSRPSLSLPRSPWPSDRGSIRASAAMAAAEPKPSVEVIVVAEPFDGHPSAYK